MFNAENRNYRINVVGFSVVGLLYYLYSFFQDPSTLKANPLYTEGAYGLIISIVGASFSYYYFRYGKIPIIKILILSVILFVVWIGGVMYIGSNLTGNENVSASVAWIGILTIMYFMFIGAINGLLGFWISLFNIVVLGQTLFSGESSEPFMWVNVLGLAGIDDPVFLWGVVLISGLLGVSDKGYEFFINQQE